MINWMFGYYFLSFIQYKHHSHLQRVQATINVRTILGVYIQHQNPKHKPYLKLWWKEDISF